MNWPQITVLVLLIIGFVFQCVKSIRSDKSTAYVTGSILGTIGYYAAYVGVLHAGGFW